MRWTYVEGGCLEIELGTEADAFLAELILAMQRFSLGCVLVASSRIVRGHVSSMAYSKLRKNA